MKIKYRQYLEQLQNLTNKTYSHADLSKILTEVGKNVTANALANRLSNDGYINEEEQNIINEKLLKSSKKNLIAIDYYPDVLASCGNGTYEMSQEVIKYDVPANLFPPSKDVKSYSMCHAKGNSMYPRIWDGDFVICEHKDNMKIENGEMYIFCFDDQIYLKRLTKNINQIVVESENPDFPTQYIEKEQMNDVHLIGHVICSGRMNGKYLDKRN